jgi:hypothetical protein
VSDQGRGPWMARAFKKARPKLSWRAVRDVFSLLAVANRLYFTPTYLVFQDIFKKFTIKSPFSLKKSIVI